ncbi:MAG: NHL repeat-containing protein [Candidatus Zixiibacteriota bacterium]|jgi:DNA-binding beta-propeller fold protein YncE
MLTSFYKTLITVVLLTVSASGYATARDDAKSGGETFRKIVFLINDFKNLPDYIKAGEWRVDSLRDWHAAPPPPIAVAPTGEVFLATEGQMRYYSNTGSLLGEWELPDAPFPSGYFGLGVTPYGAVFAADHSAGRVYGFTPQGRLISKWEAKVGPLAIGPNGDIYASTGKRIQRYDANGVLLGEWGSNGTLDRDFGLALYLTVGPDGAVYVLDFDSGRVQCFTAEGSYLRTWEPTGARLGERQTPRGIAAGPDGDVFIFKNPGVKVGCRLERFTAAGSFVGSFGLSENRGTVYGPGIAVAPDGTLYIADREDGRIRYYKPSSIFHIVRYSVFGIAILVVVFFIALYTRFFFRKRKRQVTGK